MVKLLWGHSVQLTTLRLKCRMKKQDVQGGLLTFWSHTANQWLHQNVKPKTRHPGHGAVQLRGLECGVRVILPGTDPSSITYQLGDFGQESLNILTLGLSFLICTVGPITYPIHGITRQIS